MSETPSQLDAFLIDIVARTRRVDFLIPIIGHVVDEAFFLRGKLIIPIHSPLFVGVPVLSILTLFFLSR